MCLKISTKEKYTDGQNKFQKFNENMRRSVDYANKTNIPDKLLQLWIKSTDGHLAYNLKYKKYRLNGAPRPHCGQVFPMIRNCII